MLLALLLSYLAISLHALSVVPPVYEDEPWQASTGWKLATEGTFGSDMFSGFHGMERHYYAFMPVHPLLLAFTFKIAGLGLLQARLESVAMGLAILLLTYTMARRLFGPEVGLLAVALLLMVRLTGTTRNQLTGILLLDMVRIARYDIVVPVFGLLSLHTYVSAAARADLRLYSLAGVLAALAGLSHLYGIFWIVCLGLLAVCAGGGFRHIAALGAGFVVPWLLYLAYVTGGLADWQDQVREYAPRFDLLNPWWYWQNVIEEPRRYGPGLGPPGWHYVARPGFWAWLAAFPACLLALARLALAANQAARVILVPIIVFVTAFALLISMKLVNYTVTILPLGMIAVAWGFVSLWKSAGQEAGRRWVQMALACLLGAVIVEGSSRVAVLAAAGRSTTPYADYIAKVRAHVPPGSRVLGLQDYWFGLHDLEYRSWLVPIRHTDPAHAASLSLDQAMDAVAPDVILIDGRMRAYFATRPADPVPAGIEAWMDGRGFERRGVVTDETYGTMEVFVRDR